MAIDFDRVIVTVDDNVADLSAGQSILLASGVPGHSATIAVGTVTTLPAGSPATVENVGDENDAIFNFGIPKGADGDNAPEWGAITGTLSDQTDLKAALDAKADASDLQDVEDAVADKASVITPTLSDSLITMTDAANAPVKDLTVAIDPVQDLHGYDAPWPAGGGKNLLNPNIYSMITDKNGLSTTVKSDNVITLSGTASANTYFILNQTQNVAKKTNTSLILPAGTYTFSARKSDGSKLELGGSITLYYWYENDENEDRKAVSATSQTYTSVTLVATETVYVSPSVYIVSGRTTNFDIYFQLEAGSSATSFAPYSNICPISGWTGCNVWRTGKNLLPNLKYEVSNTSIALGQNQTTSVKTIYLKPGTYTLSVSTNNATVGLYYRKSVTGNTNYNMNASGNVGRITVTEADYFSFWAYKSDGLSIDDVLSFQLELGLTATAYEPYSGTTLSIDWTSSAGTVYGGTLDVTTGVLTVTDAQIASYNGETLPSTWISDRDAYASGTTPTTGAQVVYKLATPITYQLTPQEVTTLLGMNAIWADTGDCTLTYRADTKAYIDNAIAESQQATRSLIAGIETTTTATKNYSIGDLLIVGDALYKVTSAIANGGTITPGTNVTATTVAEQLILLANS